MELQEDKNQDTTIPEGSEPVRRPPLIPRYLTLVRLAAPLVTKSLSNPASGFSLSFMSHNKLAAYIRDCFAFDEIFPNNVTEKERVRRARTAILLRPWNRKLSITDGPFAETKEYLGGTLLDAED
ncbi:hypothetical protein L0222_22105 [bacterium]|nr:hypothetical protein [bacterium]MCI0604799.1 hypothetical protein [bacterium]